MHDPIVAEVRAIREKLAAECGFDLGRIVEEARRHQAASQHRVVSFARNSPVGTAGSFADLAKFAADLPDAPPDLAAQHDRHSSGSPKR